MHGILQETDILNRFRQTTFHLQTCLPEACRIGQGEQGAIMQVFKDMNIDKVGEK